MAQKRRAFRSLVALLGAWECHRGLWRAPSDLLLLEALGCLARVELRRVHVDAENAADLDFADCLFTLDPDSAMATVRGLLPRVPAALQRLASMRPRGSSRPKGLRCRSCDRPLTDALACEFCQTGHCPYCGTGAHCWVHDDGVALDLEECPHVVASPEDWGDWRISPFEVTDLPCLPEDLAEIEWTAAEIESAFGDLAPLLEAYEEGFACQPDTHRLFAIWAESAPLPVVCIDWTDGNMSEARGEDYYTPDPAAFHRAVCRLQRGIDRGFRRLERCHSRTLNTNGPQCD